MGILHLPIYTFSMNILLFRDYHPEKCKLQTTF